MGTGCESGAMRLDQPGAPKQLTEYMKVEIPRWAKVVKESGARAE